MNDGSAPFEPILCSNCFVDEGLGLDAIQVGVAQSSKCPRCQSTEGAKLDKQGIRELAARFFVTGTLCRLEYGAAPYIQVNDRRPGGEIDEYLPERLRGDVKLLEEAGGIGFFLYGPRSWMVGDVTPLKEIQDPANQRSVIDRLITEYPVRTLGRDDKLYRLRKTPRSPSNPLEYDSPPDDSKRDFYRLDSKQLPVLYASQNLEICIHECRVTAEDELFLATLKPKRELRLLDLSEVLKEEGVTEFESLDMAVHMLFMAGGYAYDITRTIAAEGKNKGFDGLIYQSFF